MNSHILFLLCIVAFCHVGTTFQLASRLLCRSYINTHATRSLASSFKLNMQVEHDKILMPALSSTMTEGKIVSWAKKVGDKVSAGDVLLVVESDKADMDVESYEEGYLASILVGEGESSPVGAPVAFLAKKSEDIKLVQELAEGGSGSNSEVRVETSSPPAASVASSSISTGMAPSSFINMPALSSTMTEGKIVSWAKKVGDKVSAGDVLLVVESDKADMDVESYEEGYLASILVGEGESSPVGAPVAYLAKTVDEIKSIQEFAASGGISSSTPTFASPIPVSSQTTTSTSPVVATSSIVNEGRVVASGYAQVVAKEQGIDLKTVSPSRSDGYITAKDVATGSVGASTHVPAPGVINATPMARKYAADNKLDLSKLKGTGNFGRVTADDVLIAAGKLKPKTEPIVSVAAASPVTVSSSTQTKPIANAVLDGIIPMDGMQKAVAKNMEKTMTAPVFRVSREIITDNFDELYAQLKPKGVTVSSLLAKAVSEVLKKHPIMNAAYVEGGIKYNKDINIAMAVSIDGGLITPTITQSQDMDLFSMSRKWKELVEKAKGKKLSPVEYSSGTFTISNLGMFGVSSFDSILPSGTGAILAIAASTPKVVQLKNGHFGVQKSMIVTITCDHRHIYGASAAEFLKDLADILENKTQSLLMG